MHVENMNESIKNLYLTDEYIIKNPSLHSEDSPWKVTKMIPLIDQFTHFFQKDEINLLDVGGGAGIILDAASTYLKERYGKKVNKFALDLSLRMLEIQKKRNPDLKKAFHEDICKTSLGKKEIDLTLMIDLLEHVPQPTKALEEVRRISQFVILKVPLEDNLFLKISNIVTRGETRQQAIETIGHINVYNFHVLKDQIERHMGKVEDFYFTNVFEYFRKSDYYQNKISMRGKVLNFVASYVFRLSPKLCSAIFNDFVMILVRCY